VRGYGIKLTAATRLEFVTRAEVTTDRVGDVGTEDTILWYYGSAPENRGFGFHREHITQDVPLPHLLSIQRKLDAR
jgi:hypothetical protein